ncbi:NfeD family protein [Bradyrhizobium sp. USDA 10063]
MLQLASSLIVVAVLAFLPSPVFAQATKSAALLEIERAIGPATTEYIRDGFKEARERNAGLIVLRLNTPGGLALAMRDVIGEILESPIPIIAYVSPSGARAASAGTYIVYASHLAAMAPSTHLGAATPVQLGGGLGRREDGKEGENPSPSAAEAKAINDAVAYIRGLAELRGRNADWAEKAVRQAATLTASNARAERVIEIIAPDVSDLLAQANGRSVRVKDEEQRLDTSGMTITPIKANWRIRFLETITDPNIAYILMLIGLYGLLFEFISPGAVFPGVIGGIALLVGLYALNLLPINYAGAGLLLLGIALMIAEAFLPSFGVLGLGGIAAFAVGSLFLFRGAGPGFHLSWPVVATATAASAGFLVIALSAVWRAHRRTVTTGDAALLGSTGQVLSWANGEGDVEVSGERWRARSAAQLSPGQRVRVVERRNLTVFIEPESNITSKP